ncbi:MAG: hypothetical protein LBB56_02600, partial [Chitinispirillales bacterium]|nr:hypothetical protein [Chitinispirillales bacterium]
MYRENSFTDIYKAAGFCALLALFCAAGAVYSEDGHLFSSSIDEIELMAQPRGIVLVISGSGPIAVSGRPDELEKATSKYSEVRVSIKNAASGLGAKSFSVPAELPVKEIALKETSGGVDLVIKMRGVANGPVMVRGNDNQIRILLTKDEHPQMSWTASTGRLTVSAQAAQSQKKDDRLSPNSAQNRAAAPIIDVTIPSDKQRSLNNIRLLQRDRTVSLNFDFSDDPAASVNKAGDSLIIRFSNAVSSLGTRVYTVPGNTVYSSVRVRQERAADKSSSVTAVVKLNKKFAHLSPVGTRLDNQYALYAESADSAKVFLWSALEGVQSNVSFAQIEAEPIDMQKMESRAAKD